MIRHGRSEWNEAWGRDRRANGDAGPSPLSEDGRRQAREAAERLAALGVEFAIVASAQQRALETASIIASRLGIDEIDAHHGLRERNRGAWRGLTADEIERDYPGWLTTRRVPDDAETDEQCVSRATRAMLDIAIKYRGRWVLAVGHSGIIRRLEDRFGHGWHDVPHAWGRVFEVTGDDRIVCGPRLALTR
jgi:probable phosphoglycerate mutase